METFEKEMNDMKEYYGSGETKKVSWRESQLKGLRRFLIEKEEDILKALMLDLGKHQVETFRDEAKLPQIALLSSADIVPEHLGVVLLISSWNFPFGLSLELLIGVVAAGNTVVLKPSELSPACSSILALGLPNFLDNKAIKVVQGGPYESQQLLQQKWDKIFFTSTLLHKTQNHYTLLHMVL
ncbi:aldehyde dehydrogenase family 3 member F1 isoform X2 [Arachis hypogaea]|uniref:aldehyde dehydrogenase family 3 member F1 isoform X2 n=1 Tax=Arachis hypogaea TaxID=3818 RepID=UPI000DEC458C|nr:aldehyde dehydrogenase family 3 member F1 isoform X2 [Arachis hypogaea]QHO57905.1 Aldehyde dehydrogenase family 3 member [Arachis hypogaea]